jgi:asparagine synthase (glutamine-hydrolysing)
LSGDGGDELFGGYDRYRAMMLAARVRSATPSVLLSAAARSAKRSKHGGPKGKFERFRRFLESCDLSDEQRYETYMSLDGRRLNSLFADSYLESQGNRISNLGSPLIGFQFRFANQIFNDSVRAALEADRRIYLKYDLLTKVDRCSMMHGLEVRSPFMDHELVQFAAGLTTDQLLKGGPKRMLREAFAEDLPDFVFKRKKMGFAVPIGEWFRRELRPMLRDHLFAADSFAAQHFNRAVVERLVIEHEQSRVDHSQRLYALLMLELWWKTCR